jgi:hypothetical protein
VRKRYISVLIVMLIMALALIPALYGKWIDNGIPICTAAQDQDQCQLVSDGAGGAVITWEDSRSIMGGGIFAQVINERGAPQGAPNGVAIQTDLAGGRKPQLATDGMGGAVITWYDGRNLTNWKVYARRIDASGNALWADDGVEMCTAAGDQEDPYVAASGAGECIIAWEDGRGANLDIYAQLVDTSGATRWTSNGVDVCTAGGDQQMGRVVSDSSGGAIIMWMDERGSSIDVYAQRVNAQGTVRWTPNGVAICTAPGGQERPTMTTDGAGGAIMTWNDQRIGSFHQQVYVQRVDSTGTVRWTTDGVVIDTLAIGGDPAIIADGSGGAILTWDRGGNIHAQRVDADGNILWTVNGVAVCTAAGTQENPQLTTDGLGGAIIAWEDSRNAVDDIYAARVDVSGTVLWTLDGVAVCTAAGYQRNLRIESDGVGGVIVIWEDGRSGSDDIYAAGIDAGGTLVPTLLQYFSASLDESAVTITWRISEIGDDMEFLLLRAEATSELFEEIVTPKIDVDGYSFSFRDDNTDPGTSYRYRVEVSDEKRRRILFETDPISIPSIPLTLYQNYPNPFNPATMISFTLPENTDVNLSIYNLEGKLVKTFINNTLSEGYKQTSWDGTDSHGDPVASGVYFYRLKVGNRTLTKKMVLLK